MWIIAFYAINIDYRHNFTGCRTKGFSNWADNEHRCPDLVFRWVNEEQAIIICLFVNAYFFVQIFRTSYNNRVIYNIGDAAQILNNAQYNRSRATVLYIHGLNESPQEVSVQIVINGYLLNGNFNVLFLDWQRLAAAFYPFAVQNVATVLFFFSFF